ncbi:MAG TPA: SET domain-containing protein-lysine N-methyltransferase [Holophagaceae bacterium]|jgi:SET domain-containing protein|nr:SET domain-containing protein-lysine N-methyltransferase [Holophagaceae bacterium]
MTKTIPKKTGGPRIQVRRSGIHGKGVFALRPIADGERIIEYKGEIVSWKKATARQAELVDDPDHTFLFGIDDRLVIDANVGGNAARFINHSCDPNCETEQINHQVFIQAIRDIKPGEELYYDYQLTLDEPHTAKAKRQHACHCGAKNCRGTMLAKKR